MAEAGQGTGSGAVSKSHRPRPNPISRARVSTASAVIPGTNRASAAFSLGTIMIFAPSFAAARVAGSTPLTGRTVPSSPNSPRRTVSSKASCLMAPAAIRMVRATARSNPEPCFGRCAGSRLTVSRCCGHRSPELTTAALTRSRDSVKAVSGRPDTTRRGSPGATSASTVTASPMTPTSAIEQTRPYPIAARRSERAAQMLDRRRTCRLRSNTENVKSDR